MAIPSAPQSLAPWLDRDRLVPELPSSPSSELQEETADTCLPFLLGQEYLALQDHGLPGLSRSFHQRFLQQALGRLPGGFAALDASRPWLLYWALNGLSLLGCDATAYCKGVIQTLRPIQNASGGFGGSHGQVSHLATSYAAVLALMIVGGDEAYELVDRSAIWRWLGSLKQPRGDFRMSIGGERDIRGAYCALTIVSLLNLPNKLPEDSPARQHSHETFASGLGEYIASCQTYEGGIGSIPGAEAHGAYAFCALACLCIMGDPAEVISKHLDVDALVGWLVNRQHAPEGGLAGRSNKLVDGCYSHWIGGCWPLIDAAIAPRKSPWSRYGLHKYILCCCQGRQGGLRDKPGKPPDAYHTCYNLAGLSSSQHINAYGSSTAAVDDLCAGFQWNVRVGDMPSSQATRPMHPVYVISMDAVQAARAYFGARHLE